MSVNCFLWGGSFLYDAMPVGGTETSEVQPILGGNLTTSPLPATFLGPEGRLSKTDLSLLTRKLYRTPRTLESK